MLFNLLLLAVDIEACYGSLARSRVGESAEDAYSGGFPRAVGTEEAEDFAFFNGKGNVVHGFEIAELLC